MDPMPIQFSEKRRVQGVNNTLTRFWMAPTKLCLLC